MPPSNLRNEVFGINVRENPSLIKSKIGVMPQEDNLDPDLNVLQNLIVYARYFDIPEKKSIPLAVVLILFPIPLRLMRKRLIK